MEQTSNSNTWQSLMEWAAPHRTRYITSVLLAIIGVAFSIAPYFAITNIIVELIDGRRDLSVYLIWIAVAAGSWIFRVLFHAFSTDMSHRATFSVIADVRKRITKKMTMLPLGYLLDTPSGMIKNNMVEKVDSIEPTLAHIVPEMTSNLLVPLGITIYLFVLDWRMALVSLVTIPIGMIFFMGMYKDYKTRWARYLKANSDLNATAVEYINGIEVIKAFNQSANSYQKFTSTAREAAASAIDWMKSVQVSFSMAVAVFPATLVTVLPVGCVFFMNGSLDMETFIMITLLSLGIMPPLITALSYSDDLAKISTIVDDISLILNEDNLVRPEKRAALPGYNITLQNVNFAYKQEQVLHDVNIEIPVGTVTALVGPSGGGKSTIARLIASLWDIKSGSISIGGVNIKDIPLEQINDLISYVFQDDFLFNDTVRNNIRIGNYNADDKMVEEVAKASGCHDFIMHLENGYETVVGGGGGHLSGGERQRIAIARAMMKDAPIVILDEATAYTDPENEASIQNAVAKLVQGKTLIVIAHRLSTITDSDNIVVINEGKVVMQGTHHHLLDNCPLYRNMWLAHIESRDETEEVTA